MPSSIRRKLGLKTGDKFETDIQNGKIVLSPKQPKKKPRMITSPVTGLAVFEIDLDTPEFTH